MTRTIHALQFGNVYQRPAAGYALVSRVYANPCYLWATAVNEGASMGVADPLLEGYVHARQPAEFWLGLPDGTYTVTLTGYDPETAHGPFAIKANGHEVIREAAITPGTVWHASFAAEATAGALCLAFAPAPGKDFLVNGLIVEGPDEAVPQPIFKTAPPTDLPSKEELARPSDEDPAHALRRVCDWLIEHRRADGFIGDAWSPREPYWYTASMPLRALLAGYAILGEPHYLATALAALDLFAGEQLPNGAFADRFRGVPTAALSEAEVQRAMIHDRQPMSDIGSVVTALAVASRYATGARREQYIAAVRHFCDDWAARFQEPSGAFTDGLWGKDHLTTVYSCATAIQAATHAIAFAVTGERRYIQVAQRAMAFLLPDWREDGRMLGRAPHWLVRSRQPFVMETLYFGDQWYYDEGFITTSHHVPDAGFRQALDQAIGWRVFGAEGLLHALQGRVWWPIQNIWLNAKSIGMVQTLLHAQVRGMATPALKETLTQMRRFLCTPRYAQRVGVMVDDTERPAGVHGIQTWSGMGMEATGFAGMTLAEMIRPGVLYLAS